jgi:hypothetical protein
MRPEEKAAIAAHQRRRFNELAEVFDTPQPPDVMERLGKIVSAAELRQGETVLDVGTGVGVLIPLIKSYHPRLRLGGKDVAACPGKVPGSSCMSCRHRVASVGSGQRGRNFHERDVR